MSDKYTIRDQTKAHFITLTVVGWIDVFTRLNQKNMIIDALRFCQENKGLIIYAYCLMPSHLHMICQAQENAVLSDILRDLKKFTSKKIIKLLHDEPESRKEWMTKLFEDACRHLKRNVQYKVWQDGNQSKELFSNKFIWQKLNYIHMNPVTDKIVARPYDYLFSSARNYAGLDSLLDVTLLSPELKTTSKTSESF